MSGFWHDHAWLGGLLGDGTVADHLGAASMVQQMLAVEAAFARALGAVERVREEVAARASRDILAFQPDMQALRAATVTDGVPVPELLRQLRSSLPAEVRPALHAGLTSQDVVDTAFLLCLRPVVQSFAERLGALMTALDQLEERFGTHKLMAKTRMQPALEISVSHRLASWRDPIAAAAADLPALVKSLAVIQFGGLVGDRVSFGDNASTLAACFAQKLDLVDPGQSWHADRKRLVDFANWMSGTTGALGKLGADIALMALHASGEIALSGGGGSSAMVHKQNPINAELLVTLARWNATLLGGIHQAQVHEHERSGSAWTLEWLILPQMVEATAHALETCRDLCQQIDRVGTE